MGQILQISEHKQPLSPKDRAAWLADRGHLSPEQAEAGNRLMRQRERGIRVAYASSGSGGGAGQLNPLEAHMTAKRQYERAATSLGPLGHAVVYAVLIDGMSLEDAGRAAEIHPKAVLPVLRVCLDVLRAHYALP